MANRKVLIESILGLAQKIGANPSKFMGTKSNINFLGTGDRGMKGTTFSGQLNEDFLDLGFGKNDMIKIIEQDAGYVTAGKLNDSQLNTMFNNLKMIDETFNPPPGPLNVIDLETGTRNINKEGLESLRETDQIKRFTQGLGTSKTAMSNKIKEGIESLKNRLTGGADDIATKAKAEESFLKTGAADFSDSIEAEGARRAVVRQVLAKEPDFFMLPPEVAESIVKFKDLGKGGSSAPDPLAVFRNIGNFTQKELEKIDFIIDQKLFDDTSVIAEDVLDYIKEIRPKGFRPGFRSGKSVKGIAGLLEGQFTKAEVVIERIKNTIKGNPDDKYVQETFPNMIKELEAKPELANNANVWKMFSEDMPKNQRLVEHSDGSISFFRQTEFGPQNIKSSMDFAKKHDLTLKEASRILKMEPEDQILEITRIKATRNMAEGGRIGYRSGKSVKDGIAALLKLGNKKFGKGTLKTADDIEPSEFAKFNERNRQMTNDEIRDFADEFGIDPTEEYYNFDGTLASARKIVKDQKAYEAAMFTDYKAGKLDPKPGESGRKRFLEKKAEEAQMSGDSRLFTPDEADELASMQKYGGPKTDDYYRQSLKIDVDKLPVEELTPEALKVKFPGMPDKMAQMVGTDTNLQRKAEAIATLEQAFLLKDSGKSIDEIIATFNAEPKTKMKKGGLAQILEM